MMIFHNLPLLSQDARGTIRQFFAHDAENINIQSILLISSKAGAVRSNHYHKTDSHYCYLLSGLAIWFEKSVVGMELEHVILSPGDMIFTPPMTIHAVRFLEDSQLLVFTTKLRDPEHYEDDTVCVELIQP